MADDVFQAASDRIEREFTPGAYVIPDVREAAARAGFGVAPETVTVTYVPVTDLLEDREAGPEPQWAGDRAEYEARWHLWRAIRRDARLTNAELDARFRVLAERLGYPGVGLWDER